MSTSTQTTTVGVQGMTCGHCVSSVDEELRALTGVTAVDVDLVTGGTSTVTITSTEPLSDEAVAGAIDEAGYTIAPPRSLI
ncbi:heavy-metal-associated domain-containing protein [Actinotalea sp. C106]|uniref:heavy-metal-associated domain-containing protein n=1 Tax=Actinotalea sp. C106 TaxID=2908644 RepID=UPI0020285434|nr:cation transporter [Actinotalea sp. C106]